MENREKIREIETDYAFHPNIFGLLDFPSGYWILQPGSPADYWPKKLISTPAYRPIYIKIWYTYWHTLIFINTHKYLMSFSVLDNSSEKKSRKISYSLSHQINQQFHFPKSTCGCRVKTVKKISSACPPWSQIGNSNRTPSTWPIQPRCRSRTSPHRAGSRESRPSFSDCWEGINEK